MRNAPPGDDAPTRLYSVWNTPEKELADMGVGVGVYFTTLRHLGFVLLVAAIINIPNCRYYDSDDYNHDDQSGIPFVLQRSAICTDFRWVACPSCSRDQWDYFPATFDRYAESDDGKLRFIQINLCSFGYYLGLFNWMSIIFCAAAIYTVCFHVIKRVEVKFDEGQQTTTDYSINVENPPKDARDAQKWKDFFSQFGHVTCCTITVDNEELVRALVQRRKLLFAFQQVMPPDVIFDKDNLEEMEQKALPVVWWQLLIGLSSASTLRRSIEKLDEKILELSEKKFDVAEVFITFEREQAQRSALEALCVARLATLTQNKKAIPHQSVFDGKHVLSVMEPPEPSSVRWQDLDDSLKRRLSIRFATFVATGIMITVGAIIIIYTQYKYGPAMAALVISLLNSMAPYACYALSDLESHPSEDDKQTSKYSKVTATMWVFTALVTAAVTPYTETVSNSNGSILHSLYAIFVFELIRGPVTQLADISGNVYRHLLGPRVTNRLQLAGLFQGTAYELSQRYTNMTNVLFLTFYYATIFPPGFLFAALTLFVHYWTDKFCLLRVWAPAPRFGKALSEFSRHFIVVTLVVYAVISSYYVAGFPFDNACESQEKVPADYIGNFTATDGEGNKISISIDEGDSLFYFCNMDMMMYEPPAFPAWASNQPEGTEWMDKDQRNIAWLFGWTSVFVVALVGLIILNRVVIPFYRYMFVGLYQPVGRPSEIGFSDDDKIFAYIPQVRVYGFSHPLLVCNVNNIDVQLIGWNDPKNGINTHNVIYDIPQITDKTGIFSEVYHWPPPQQK